MQVWEDWDLMAINRIYIPTYGRVGKQKTYDNLPDKWKEKTYLVVSPDEIHSGYQTISCPIQGKGIAPVRKWIAEHGKEKRYAVLDDDIEFVYTRRENEDGPSNKSLTNQQFDDMFNTMNNWIDEGYIHVACDVCWNPPTRNLEYKVNSRITNNIFYDGTKLPIEKIDWTSLDIAEDYYVNLQLLTMCTGNLRNKLTTNPRSRRDKVIQTMQEHDPSLYKEIIRYLKDGNYYNPL